MVQCGRLFLEIRAAFQCRLNGALGEAPLHQKAHLFIALLGIFGHAGKFAAPDFHATRRFILGQTSFQTVQLFAAHTVK